MNNFDLPFGRSHSKRGRTISLDLETSAHCYLVLVKEFIIFQAVRRAFGHLDFKPSELLYTVAFQEFNLSNWSPFLKTDKLLKKV